ncbi:MAG: tyrosine-type recombinase/integrase [Magnetovibrio sp.]|nr:tyrosine-type recombinase/integrase [Magnetovibrio sp.]
MPRGGEFLDLRWDNIDLKTRVARLIDTKNGENRDLPLSSRAIEVLKILPKLTNGFVFQTSSEGLKNAYERARKRANLQHVNFHDLRHEAAYSKPDGTSWKSPPYQDTKICKV